MFWFYVVFAYYMGGFTLASCGALPMLWLTQDHESAQKLWAKTTPLGFALTLLKVGASWPVLLYSMFRDALRPNVATVLVAHRQLDQSNATAEKALEAEALQVWKSNFCAECTKNFHLWYDERQKKRDEGFFS